MAVFFFHMHFPGASGRLKMAPIENGGELPVLYCFIFLYLSAAGAGPLSLDRALRRK
jgi:putative oxidoreductase